MTATSPLAPNPAAPQPAEALAYISDMLCQLADLARGVAETKLEGAMRLLALEAAQSATAASADRPVR